MLRSIINNWMFFSIIALPMLAQVNPTRAGNGSISGYVYDTDLKNAISYAEIIVFTQSDSSQVTGGITRENGKFEIKGIRPGRYMIEVFFLGYHSRYLNDIVIRRQDRDVDLGRIGLRQTTIAADAVLVEGRKPPVSYQIDRKVINVDEQQTVISGSAVDVMENVPSVTVGIDGDVSLRGSSNFRVLVDGRPSVLDASDALQQIPATSIESIEIITNPSAKFDPEGTAGIVNIILKKNRQQSRSALLNLNTGFDDKYGADALVDIKRETYSVTLGANFNRRSYDGTDTEENRTSRNGLTSFIFSEGGSVRGRESMGVRGAISFQPSPKDNLTADFRYGDRTSDHDALMAYEEWDEGQSMPLQYTSVAAHERGGDYFASSVSYERKFAQKQHRLYGEASYSRRYSEEFSLNELQDINNIQTDGQRSTESGPSNRLRGRIDYTLPLGSEHKLEAGYMGQYRRSEDNTGLELFDGALGQYIPQTELQNQTVYRRTVHALYLIYAAKWQRLGYQAGLRGEYTDRETQFGFTEAGRAGVDRKDFFPSAHFSYQFTSGQQLMAGYSRRIERPRGWNLEPFLTWVDAFNVRSGNPALTPEYIDSYELGFQTFFDKNLFSTEIYYRIGHDRIERVRSVYDQNITLQTFANVGTDYAFGSEMMLNMDFSRIWNVNLMGNLYNYRIEGVLNNDAFSRESFNWNLRFNNALRFTDTFQLQFNTRYNSPTVSSQGRREGYLSADLSFKQSILEKQLSLTLQIRDLFGSEKREQVYQTSELYSFRRSNGESPVVMLNLRYNFNNYKQKRQPNRNGGGDEGED